jgi:murein DD-endopeptidase MepM/ murein hydrolase activator NlpD
MVLAPAHAQDKLKDKKNRIELGIKHAQAHLDESSKAAALAYKQLSAATASLAAAKSDLAASTTAVAKAKVIDARLKIELIHAQADFDRAHADLVVARAKVKEQDRAVGELVATQAQSASPQLLRLVALFSTTSVADTATSMQVSGNFADRQLGVLDGLTAAKTAVKIIEVKQRTARNAIAAKKREAARNLARQRAAERAAQAAKAKVIALVRTREAARAASLRAKRADMVKLAALKRENARIAALLQHRADQHPGKGYTGSQNGFLLRPVDGAVTSPYGWRKHPIYGYWGLHDGVDLQAPCGTPLRASADGTVISRYYQSAWGNRLILDVGNVNGKGVAVIYNHLSRYNVSSGAHVQRGDVIGYAGTTGWSTGCHLHFTVMADGHAVDPMPWF